MKFNRLFGPKGNATITAQLASSSKDLIPPARTAEAGVLSHVAYGPTTAPTAWYDAIRSSSPDFDRDFGLCCIKIPGTVSAFNLDTSTFLFSMPQQYTKHIATKRRILKSPFPQGTLQARFTDKFKLDIRRLVTEHQDTMPDSLRSTPDQQKEYLAATFGSSWGLEVIIGEKCRPGQVAVEYFMYEKGKRLAKEHKKYKSPIPVYLSSMHALPASGLRKAMSSETTGTTRWAPTKIGWGKNVSDAFSNYTFDITAIDLVNRRLSFEPSRGQVALLQRGGFRLTPFKEGDQYTLPTAVCNKVFAELPDVVGRRWNRTDIMQKIEAGRLLLAATITANADGKSATIEYRFAKTRG